MRDILPQKLFETLRDRYLAGVASAEALFSNSCADEDSLTGALGQAISTARPIVFQRGGGTFTVSVSYQKIRGRGPGAPEKIFGSDGLFQIDVRSSDGTIIRRKGLPFQAKSYWKGQNRDLFNQAKLIEEKTGVGIVVDYREEGYKACPTSAVIQTNGNRRAVDRIHAMRPLGSILGHDFLECRIGVLDLFYDAGEETYIQTSSFPTVSHLITTSVVIPKEDLKANADRGYLLIEP
jgi:hypothetical protein